LKEPQDLDADGFGGFETGLDSATEDNPGWLPESDPFSETKTGTEDVWGHTWGGSAPEEEEPAAQPDEWEAARLQKEEQEKQKQEQDKHVVSHLHISTLCLYSSFVSPQNYWIISWRSSRS
jgi:hypothetical protein